MSLLTRRSFLWGLVAAPAIVRVASLMPVRVFDPEDWTPENAFSFGGNFTAAEIQDIANASLDFYLNKAETFQSLLPRPWRT